MAEEKARDPTIPERKPVNVPLSKIHDLPSSVFAPPSEKSLEALTSSIVLKGVQEPVILRQREDGEFQIVSGNRRRKASELAKKAEIPAFVYDMTEKEAKAFRFRDKGAGTPHGKLLLDGEIGKKREEPAKAPEKAAGAKTAPTPDQKKAEEKPKTIESAKKAEEAPKTVSAENAKADGKKPDMPPKSLEKGAGEKATPAPDAKKPVENTPPAESAEKSDAAPKKQDAPPKQPDKSADTKSEPIPPAQKPDTDSKKLPVSEKPREKPSAAKPIPTVMTGPAALGPTGTKITKIFDDRLSQPDEKAMKSLPVPKDGESYFITLHPAYLEKSEFNTVSVDVNSDDYKELRKSIELNGVKDPVLTRINTKGGLEILSGQRRHMIARELNYPVPAIIQKIDDNDAMILVADSNLHRPHISTYDLSRTLRNKMTAMKRKAGRKKRGEVKADELDSDEQLAKEMGISVSKLNRIVRLSEATKPVCEAVDDNSLELSIASALSFMKPENQNAVIDLMGIGYKPNMKRVQRLRDAEKGGTLNETAMRRILNDQDVQPPEQPKPTQEAAPIQTPTAPTTANPSIPAKQKAGTLTAGKPPESAAPVSTPLPEKADGEPKQADVAPTEVNTPSELQKPSEKPIEFNSQRDNLYVTKVTLGGDRLRKYFPDISMTPLAIVESIYSALEERRQREERQRQKTELLHPSKPSPNR